MFLPLNATSLGLLRKMGLPLCRYPQLLVDQLSVSIYRLLNIGLCDKLTVRKAAVCRDPRDKLTVGAATN
jgi:hypothetical protein